MMQGIELPFIEYLKQNNLPPDTPVVKIQQPDGTLYRTRDGDVIINENGYTHATTSSGCGCNKA